MAEGDGEQKASSGTPPVFISYASPDATVAEAIVEALERQGLECWIAPRDVTAGAPYAGQIIHAIDAAKASVLILSRDAAASPHVLREVERTASKRHSIVALRIDQAPLPADFEYFLNTSHWLDASAGDIGRALPKLVAAVKLALQTPAVPPADAPTSHASAPAVSARPPKKIVAMIVASVIGLGLVGFAAVRLWLSHRHATPPPVHALAAPTPAPPTPTAPTIPEKSVAVLPFVDMSEKKDQEYFSDGLSEELIDMLTKVPELRVPARTSSFYFKGKQATIADIANALNVAHVLEGSVRKSGNTLRITAQLIRVDNGYHVWSETYDRQLTDIFKVQDEIADSVVRALKASLFEGEARHAAVGGNAEAYNLLLLARFHHYLGTKADTKKAIEYYQQAVSLDPTSAPAWAGLSRIMTNAIEAGVVSRKQAYESALRAAKRALTLDRRLAEAHIALGRVWFELDWDWPAAQAEFNTARELDPHYSWASIYAGDIAFTLGHLNEAIQYYRDAITQDPLNHWAYSRIVDPYRAMGRLAEMEEAARKALELSPAAEGSHAQLGMVQLLAGRNPASALAEIARDPDLEARGYALAWAYQVLGRKVDADGALVGLEATNAESLPYGLASLHAMRGEVDRAFLWLDRTYIHRDPALTSVMVDPDLQNLRHDVRYKAFLRKMKLSE